MKYKCSLFSMLYTDVNNNVTVNSCEQFMVIVLYWTHFDTLPTYCGILQLNVYIYIYIHCESKKQDTILLSVTSPMLVGIEFNAPLELRQILTDFQNSFTVRLCGKFVTKPYLNIPPRLKHVATLPCEISMFKKSPCSISNWSKLSCKT